MSSELRALLLEALRVRYGAVRKLDNSQSLFDVGNGACRVYVRYSKVHDRQSTFYGLRREDLRLLEGQPSVICFLWEGQAEPPVLDAVRFVVEEVDVIWLERGSGRVHAMFEVEYSTPVYSGLLRFNDILLTAPNLGARFSVVSNDERRALFTRQMNRPTFRMSKLDACCTFIEYGSVFGWHRRLTHHDRS